MTEQISKCERWQESISLLAAECLPAAEEAIVRQHLANCVDCAARLAELRSVCGSLKRSRPSAAIPIARISERLQDAVECVTPGRSFHRIPSLGLWLSGALAASLLIAAVWLTQRQSGISLPGPQEPRVAIGGPTSVKEQAPLLAEVSPSSEKLPVEQTSSQLTLRDYVLALAESNEAFEALLQLRDESGLFEPYDPKSFFKESY
jgi:hypothetical protein